MHPSQCYQHVFVIICMFLYWVGYSHAESPLEISREIDFTKNDSHWGIPTELHTDRGIHLIGECLLLLFVRFG